MKTLRAKHSTELDLSKVVEKLQSEKESLKAEHSTEFASIRGWYLSMVLQAKQLRNMSGCDMDNAEQSEFYIC